MADYCLGKKRPYGIHLYPGSGSADDVDGDHIIIAPAYNITEKDVHEIVDRTEKVIKDFFSKQSPVKFEGSQEL
jgi:adenosylmethionine-8-amino-7-oxononanoate aminotransferase